MIKLMIQFNGKQLTLPINPEELEPTQAASNTDINIIGLGKTTRKGEPGLISLKIDSFFPAPNSYFYTGVKPLTCVDFIKEIWNADNVNNNVAKFVTSGLPKNLNMYFVIENFTYDSKAGEEEDIYYSLKIKQYKPYGAKIVKSQLTGLAAARAKSTTAKPKTTTNQPTVQRYTYTVVSGDCLWNISKACSGDGNNWRQLYDLNKSVVGGNPNLIYPGQVLTLPEGWTPPYK